MPLYLNLEECHFAEGFQQLLVARPELSLEPLTPGVWAELLRGVLADSWDPKKPLGSGAVGRCFSRHRHILEQKLTIVKSKHTRTNGWHYQIALRPEASTEKGGATEKAA